MNELPAWRNKDANEIVADLAAITEMMRAESGEEPDRMVVSAAAFEALQTQSAISQVVDAAHLRLVGMRRWGGRPKWWQLRRRFWRYVLDRVEREAGAGLVQW